MKQPLLFLLFIFSAFTALAQKPSANQFTLKGRVIGQDSGYIRLGYFNSARQFVNDSCTLDHGVFQFTGLIDGTTRATISGNTKSRSVDDPNWAEIFLEPTDMEAVFTVNEFKHAKISGSTAQDEFRLYMGRLDSLNNKWREVLDAFASAKSRRDFAEVDKLANEQIPVYLVQNNQLSLRFIKEFPGSNVSAYLLFNQVGLSVDSLKYYYSLLTPGAQHSFYGSNVDSSITKEEHLQIGRLAPDFLQVDLRGRPVSLAMFRGKYVLLDFWASWCIPCREEHPYLKKAYARYHDKGFEIIAYSLDVAANKQSWLKAVQADGLPWIQLCDFRSWNSDLVSAYNYLGGRGIPANFLINPKGEIIAKDLRGDALEKALGKLLK